MIQRLIRFAFAVLLVGLAGHPGIPAAAAETRDGVFIHISRGPEDPHRVLMGLNMAHMMAEQHPVLVYFDIEGVRVVLNDAPDLSFAQFPSSRTQIPALLAKGVTLMACPGCLRAAGKTAADLMPGVLPAERERFFTFTGGRILTIDY
jgi:predicted peroxiredoxin